MKHNKLYILGITGTIGSGKSVVGELLAKKGVQIIDADILARQVVSKGSPALEKIKSTFGDTVIDNSGVELDRKALGKIVFSSPEKRLKLEGILHPLIRERFLAEIKILSTRSSQHGRMIIGYLVPLLFESKNKYEELDKIVVVSAPREICIERIKLRDKCTTEEAVKRLDAQLPIEAKEKAGDYLINNSGNLEELEREVDALYDTISAQLSR